VTSTEVLAEARRLRCPAPEKIRGGEDRTISSPSKKGKNGAKRETKLESPK